MYGKSFSLGPLSLALDVLILSLFFNLSRNRSLSFVGCSDDAADISLPFDLKLSVSLRVLYFPSME